MSRAIQENEENMVQEVADDDLWKDGGDEEGYDGYLFDQAIIMHHDDAAEEFCRRGEEI